MTETERETVVAFEFNDMVSGGQSVPAALQRRAFVYWLWPGECEGYSSLGALMNRFAPMPEDADHPYSRAADSLVQKLRKAGMIEKVKRKWRLTEAGAEMRKNLMEDGA